MLPSMPLISTPAKECRDETNTGTDVTQEDKREDTSISVAVVSSSGTESEQGTATVNQGIVQPYTVTLITEATNVVNTLTTSVQTTTPSILSSYFITQTASPIQCQQSRNVSPHCDVLQSSGPNGKKRSPLKHVTPILKKYSTHRIGKTGKTTKVHPILPKGRLPDEVEKQPQVFSVITSKPSVFILPHQDILPFNSISETIRNEKLTSCLIKEPEGKIPRKQVQTADSCIQVNINETQCDVNEDKDSATCEMKSKGLEQISSVHHRQDNEEELAALMLASSTINSPKTKISSLDRKKIKHIKDVESTLALLGGDSGDKKEERDFAFALAYFTKVKERLEGKEDETYQNFLQALSDFEEKMLTPVDLYHKITSILNKHEDLADEFIAFLLPEQALHCRKFMEHLLMTKMCDFFRKVDLHFSKQTQHVQKIISSLTKLAEKPSVTTSDIRTTIVPLLKGNSLLIDSFLQLIPDERPPESLMTEFEDIDCDEADSDHSCEEDSFETLHIPDMEDPYGGDNCPCSCHDSTNQKYKCRALHCVPCGTKFIHGKVFIQTGKGLRPAKIVFEDKDVMKNWERLSVKDRPKGRGRKKKNNHVEHKAENKEVSPSKPVAQSSPNSMHSSQTEEMKTESDDDISAEHQITNKSAHLTLSPKSRQTKPRSGTTQKTSGKAGSATGNAQSAKQLSFQDIPVILAKRQSETNKFIVEFSKSSSVEAIPSFSLSSLSSSVPVEVYDESAILPPDSTSGTVPLSDFSSLSEVLRREELKKDSLEIKCVNVSSGFSDRLLSEVSKVHERVHSQRIKSSNIQNKPQLDGNSWMAEMDGELFSALRSSVMPQEMFSKISDSIIESSSQANPLHEELFKFELENKKEESMCNSNILPAESIRELNMDMEMDCMPIVKDENIDAPVLRNKISLCASGDPEGTGTLFASESVMDVDERDAAYADESQRSESEVEEIVVSWTREEDKIILQTFQQEGNSEQTFIKISQQLPSRSLDEIMGRFQILINLLQQFTGGTREEDSSTPSPQEM